MEKNKETNICNWVTMLYSRNVKQLYFNNFFFKSEQENVGKALSSWLIFLTWLIITGSFPSVKVWHTDSKKQKELAISYEEDTLSG